MKLAVDIDGCMIPSGQMIAEAGKAYFKRLGIDITVNPEGYEVEDLLGIPKEECSLFLRDYWNEYHRNASLHSDCAKSLIDIASFGVRVEAVTARRATEMFGGETVEELTRRLLKRNSLGWLPVNYERDKGAFCAENKFTHLLDDYVPNLQSAISHSVVPIAFDRPYNSDLLVCRVRSWSELRDKIQEFTTFREKALDYRTRRMVV